MSTIPTSQTASTTSTTSPTPTALTPPCNSIGSHSEYVFAVLEIIRGSDSLATLIGHLQNSAILEWTSYRHRASGAVGRDPVKVLFRILDVIPASNMEKIDSPYLRETIYTIFVCPPEQLSDGRLTWTAFNTWFNSLITEDEPTGWQKTVIDIYTGAIQI